MQTQKNQIRSYLSESEGGMPEGIHSMPNYRVSSSADFVQQQQPSTRGGSAQYYPESPLSMGMSSTATSISEVCLP